MEFFGRSIFDGGEKQRPEDASFLALPQLRDLVPGIDTVGGVIFHGQYGTAEYNYVQGEAGIKLEPLFAKVVFAALEAHAIAHRLIKRQPIKSTGETFDRLLYRHKIDISQAPNRNGSGQ